MDHSDYFSPYYFLFLLISSVKDKPVPFKPEVSLIPYLPSVIVINLDINENETLRLLTFKKTCGKIRNLLQKRTYTIYHLCTIIQKLQYNTPNHPYLSSESNNLYTLWYLSQ